MRTFPRETLAFLLMVQILFAPPARAADNLAKESTDETRAGGTSRTKNDLGRMLRSEIDERYAQLSSSRKLKTSGNGVNSITDIVVKYIHTGCTFPEAEKVLRAAGFKIEPIRKSVVKEGEYVVWAKNDQYGPMFFLNTSVMVGLFAIDSNHLDRIDSIVAEILVSSL